MRSPGNVCGADAGAEPVLPAPDHSACRSGIQRHCRLETIRSHVRQQGAPQLPRNKTRLDIILNIRRANHQSAAAYLALEYHRKPVIAIPIIDRLYNG